MNHAGYPPFDAGLAVRAGNICDGFDANATTMQRLIWYYIDGEESLCKEEEPSVEAAWGRLYGREAMRALTSRPITPDEAVRHAESMAGELCPWWPEAIGETVVTPGDLVDQSIGEKELRMRITSEQRPSDKMGQELHLVDSLGFAGNSELTTYGSGWFTKFCTDRDQFLRIARSELGEIMGYAAFIRGWPEYRIVRLAVHPLHRRKGVASALLHHAMTAAHIRHNEYQEARNVTFITREEQREADLFLEAAGFVVGHSDGPVRFWIYRAGWPLEPCIRKAGRVLGKPRDPKGKSTG